jgi:predicted PurR-regulated permease PerM
MAKNGNENLLKVDDSQRKALAIATVAALIAAFIFLREYLMLIAIACILAFLFYPIYNWLISKNIKSGNASMLTFLLSLVIILIPFAVVIALTIGQVSILVKEAQSANIPNVDYSNFINNAVDQFNQWMASLGLGISVSTADITSWVSSTIATIGTSILDSVKNSVTGIFSLITTVIIFIYVFLSLLKNQKFIIDTIGNINPLGEGITKIYIQKMASMTKAMVRGQFIIAVCQGFWSALVLSMVGFNNLFFFFFVILTVFSFIPLGAGIITIPLGIVMILFGDTWQGVIVILNHLLIVTNIDNVLRPKLVPKDARLDPALTMLAVFGGLGLFGFPGIVLGPVLMIVIVTTVQMFLEVFKSIDSLDTSTTKKKSFKGYFSRLTKRSSNKQDAA